MKKEAIKKIYIYKKRKQRKKNETMVNKNKITIKKKNN
jgi:hypothetical protein